MTIVDDPMLALIVRFVTQNDELEASDEEFVRRQIDTLKQYVARFPKEQKGERALEWVERNAESYRREWQKGVVFRQVTEKRCADCPLRGDRDSPHCDIHAQWLRLLKQYMADEISSRRYVENTLRLLQAHKDQLRVKGPVTADGQLAADYG